MIQVTCDKCGQRHSVSDAWLGQRARCSCGNAIIVSVMSVEEVPMRPAVEEDRTLEASSEAVPISGEPVYIEEDEDDDAVLTKQRFYCEKCKRAHLGVECPSCGSEPGNGDFDGCSYCRTDYRARRKNCPVCKVQVNLEKAEMAETPQKALKYWKAAYDEARSNGYYFPLHEHRTYAQYLIEAGREEEACGLANQIRQQCDERFSSTRHELETGLPPTCSLLTRWTRLFWRVYAWVFRVKAPGHRRYEWLLLQKQAKYFSNLSDIEEVMGHAIMAQELKYRERLGEQNVSLANRYAVHAALSLLYYRSELRINTELMPDIYSEVSADLETLEKTSIKKMRRVLIDIKKNKPGRPEELCRILNRHLESIPKVDVQALQQDVAAVLAL